MKPFNLEAAKRGDPFMTSYGSLVRFVLHDETTNELVGQIDGKRTLTVWCEVDFEYLFMAPKKRTVWVNLYPNSFYTSHWFETEKDAEELAKRGRIGGKAYPVEIEE